MKLNILDWTDIYLKYKDTAQRRIKNTKKLEEKKELIYEFKDGSTQKYLCVEDLSEIVIKEINNTRISCLNTKQNINWMIKNWQELKEINTLFIFANPQKSAHWSINPKLHEGITEKTAIKQGLISLFESIPEV